MAEIAALEMEDIVTLDGVRCFNLNDKWHNPELRDSGLGKSKKNETSLRKIPIPIALIFAGFDSFIFGRESGLLFEELSLSATKGLGNEISRWYNEFYREYADIPKTNSDGATLVFHCFRHTFTTRLDKTLIDGHPISESGGKYLTGHSDGSVRTQLYNHGLDMNYLKRYIDAIDYGQILDGVDYERFRKRRKR